MILLKKRLEIIRNNKKYNKMFNMQVYMDDIQGLPEEAFIQPNIALFAFENWTMEQLECIKETTSIMCVMVYDVDDEPTEFPIKFSVMKILAIEMNNNNNNLIGNCTFSDKQQERSNKAFSIVNFVNIKEK